MLDLLISALTGIDFLPVAAALFAICLLYLVGRLIAAEDAPELVAFGAGWGVAVVGMTVLGTMGEGSIAPLFPLLGLLAAISLFREVRARRVPGFLIGIGAASLLALLMSGRMASEWDEFSHWLHAFRYLDDYSLLPGKGRPSIESCCAAYPYGWPLLGWFAFKVSGFNEAVPGLLNLFQLILCGELFARILAGGETPGKAHHCWGVLLATLLGTTFVPKLVFTAYADVPTSAMVLACVWLVWRLAEEFKWRTVAALGLCAAALVAQKPANLILAVLVFGAGGIMTLRGLRMPNGKAVAGLAVAVVPLLLTWYLWRRYVGANLAGEELVIKPYADWNISSIPAILFGMADVARNKGGYFGFMILATGWAVWGLFKPQDDLGRLVRAIALCFLGYNAFLFFTYVAVFLPQDGERVASYWRYNTHLGLLSALIISVLSLRLKPLRPWLAKAWLPGALIVIAPVAGIKHLRFDLEPGKLFLRQTFAQIRDAGIDNVALVDPRGSGLSHVMASYEWNGRPELTVYTTGFDDFSAVKYLEKTEKADHLLIVSWNDAVAAAFPHMPRGDHAVSAPRKGGAEPVIYPYPNDRDIKVFP